MRRELQDYNTDNQYNFAYGEDDGEHQLHMRIFDPALGWGANDVTGQDALVRKIEARLMFNYKPWTYHQTLGMANELMDCYVRVVVYLDKQPNEEVPGDLFSLNSYNILAFKNLEWSQRFEILVDDRVKLCKGQWFPVSSNDTDDSRTISSHSTGASRYNLFGVTEKLEDLGTGGKIRNFPTVRYTEGDGDDGKIRTQGTVEQEGTAEFHIEGNFGGDIDFKMKDLGGTGGVVEAPVVLGEGGVGHWGWGVPGTNFVTPILGLDDTVEGQFGTSGESTLQKLDFNVAVQTGPIMTTTDIGEEENWADKNFDRTWLNLPEYDFSEDPPEDNYGLHGDVQTKGETVQNICWSGSSEVREFYMDTNFIWTKERNVDEERVKANDIKMAIITAIPREKNIEAEVLSAYVTTRIRYTSV